MKKFYSSLFILFILQFANTKSLFSQTSLYSVKATTEKQIKPSSLILPFTENWSLASFEANGWIRDCDNWTINTQQGNLRPAAEFTWDPLLQNNYSCSLASDVIDGSQLYVGQIFLDVDIRLDNRYSTGDELLIIEVFNGTSWDSITSYSNNSGFDWESYHLDVTEQARGNNFQIRFQVSGQNSFDVISWFIDNISVYRTCAPPEDLTVAASYSPTTNDLYFLVAWSTPSILFPLQKPIQNNNSDNNINIVYNNQQHSGIQSDSATLLGFNIFRKLTNEPEYSLLNFIPFSGIQNYEYRDTDIFPDFYCYKVNCIWGATGDTCISDYAHSLYYPSNDYACDWFEAINKTKLEKINFYPNPATTQLFISTNNQVPINEITIYNQLGQKVLHRNQISSPIDVSMLSQEMYVVEVVTDEFRVREKLVIKK